MKPEFIYDPSIEERKYFLDRLEKSIHITKTNVYSCFLRDFTEQLVRAAGKKKEKGFYVRPKLVLKTPEIVHRLPKRAFDKIEKARLKPIHPVKLVEKPLKKRNSLMLRPNFNDNVLYKPSVIKKIEDNKKKGVELSVPVPNRAFKEIDFKIDVPKQQEIMKDDNITEKDGKYFYNVGEEKKKSFLSFGGSGFISKIDKLIKDPNIDAIYCEGVNVPIKIDYKNHSKLNTNIIFKNNKDINSLIRVLAKRASKKVSSKEPVFNGIMKNSMKVQATLGSEYVNGKFILKR